MDGQKTLRVSTKAGYGVGDFGTNIVLNAVTLYLLYFYTDVFGISPAFAGIIFLVSKLWNACIDPFVGQLVDRTQSRWGRKRPYLLFGAVPFALAFFLLFVGPHFDQTGRSIFAMASFLLFGTALAFVNIPYASLTYVMTDDAHERSSLSGYRMTFAIIGTLIAGVATRPIVGLFSNERAGFRGVGVVFGVILAITTLIAFRSSFEHKEVTKEKRTGFRESLKAMGGNGPFLLLGFAFVACTVSNYVIASTINYYFKYVLGAEKLISIGFLCLFGAAMASVPLWLAVSRRFGKKTAFLAGMILLAAALAVFSFVPAPTTAMVLVILVFAGIGVSTIYLFPWAMIPDTVEYSIWRTGVRQEGFLYGFFTFGLKLSQAFAGFLAGFLLDAFGYVPNAMQGPRALTGISLLMTLVPLAFLVIGIILLFFYPLGTAAYARMEAEMKNRRESE